MPYKFRSGLMLVLLTTFSVSLMSQDYHDPYIEDVKLVLAYDAHPADSYHAIYGDQVLGNVDAEIHEVPTTSDMRERLVQVANNRTVPRYREYRTDADEDDVPIITVQTTAGPQEIIDQFKDAESWEDLLNIKNGLMSLLILIGGWLSAFVPGLKKIDNATYRVLTWAILVIGGAAVLGFSSIWSGAITYFFSTSLYEVVIKLIAKSPSPDPV